ncbi:MAG: ThiF family adenylyltransferase [Bilophila wadsworthia]
MPSLARTGIRDFVIADGCGGVVNLNRQHFFPRHLGLPKVEALGAVLRELNPSVILRLEQRALDGPSACGLFAGCDIVVEAVDDPEVKKNLVEALLLAGHRVVSASGMAGWGGVPMTARKLGSRLVVLAITSAVSGPVCRPLRLASSWPPLWRPMPFWKCCWASVAEALGKGGKVF